MNLLNSPISKEGAKYSLFIMTEKYCIPENKESTREVISPSGRFKLCISIYKTRPGYWNYTKGVVTRISDNHIIAEIARNYSLFHHTFFMRDNGDGTQSEWLCAGKTYLSQCFINLDSEEIYDNSDSKDITGHSFCWAKVYANPSGTILAVDGCVWGGPYEINFYDFSDPTKGRFLMSVKDFDTDYDLYCNDEYKAEWLDDDTFKYSNYRKFCPKFNKDIDDLTIEELGRLPDDYESYEKSFVRQLNYHVILKRSPSPNDASVMHIITKEASQEYVRVINERKAFEVGAKVYVDRLKSSNEIYLEFKDAFDNKNDSKLSLSFFSHFGKIYDFDEPINNAHFGLYLDHRGKSYYIRCCKYIDEIDTVYEIVLQHKEEKRVFATAIDCIEHIKEDE